MKQMISLLKAMMSQDMNLFRVSAKKNSSKLNKIMFPILMAGIFMSAIGMYLYSFAVQLSELNLTYIMLTFAMIILVILTLIEGVYKAQGILFESKDSDLLFSLPIKKWKIVFARIFKLLTFQYFYNLLFLLPAFAIYSYFEKPGLDFYVISILMTFLLPMIPTIVACLLGLLIKQISFQFKAKKIVQTLLTTVVFMGIFYVSFNFNQILENLMSNATGINELLTKIYYPVGAYIGLIQNFKVIDLLILILVNVGALAIFVMIAGKYYFKMISKSSEKGTSKKAKLNLQDYNIKENSQMKALISKELKRYFSSTVYMFNTLFGVFLMLVGTIALCVNLNGTIQMVTEGEEIGMDMNEIINLMPKIFFGLVLMLSSMSSITSSAISVEGKAFNMTKSLPVKTDTILLAKIVTSNLIEIPVILMSDIIFCIAFTPAIFDIIAIFAITFIMPTFVAIMGLLLNLKYPKMNAMSDAEIVKQSMSAMISVFAGMILAFLLIGCLIGFSSSIAVNTMILLELIILLIATILLWKLLKKYGAKRFKEINV